MGAVIGGIVVGVVILVAIISVLVLFCLCHLYRQRKGGRTNELGCRQWLWKIHLSLSFSAPASVD